jgi:hypothetical protein
VQSATDVHHHIAAALLPQAAPVLHDPTALHTAVDMLTPYPAMVQSLIGALLLPHQRLTTGFLGRHEDSTWGSVQARNPRSCNTRLPAGRGEGVASAMDLSCLRPPCVSLSKRMVSGALTSRTFFTVWSFVLPLEHAVCAAGSWGRPICRPVMGKRGEAGGGSRGVDASSGVATVAASASVTPSRWARSVSERVGASPRVRRAVRSAGRRTWSHYTPSRVGMLAHFIAWGAGEGLHDALHGHHYPKG